MAFGPHIWAGTGTASPMSAGHQRYHPPFIPPLHHQVQQHQQHHGQQGGAEHVTGMMSAAMLDDVDEGDKAYGVGSDILGD
ncbi:SCF ubiquitin ligase complex subunit [Elasticomyces elasticus]|nr:SCF ubiquitin ligase complex subunit [Elasticomyces elasticus]KAK3615800.1 SCF ubiquitin ligase complex subunit [Elasticomyces elasticus]KAK4901477.1 SCF ubiquitin ligase complex subunit [Elasticomyces elasticus]KAK5729461.1 SCF ubiquitin ligase complex subunit [Elasticomyces elasticus]